ncbi:MAG: FxDxF family PEP-CTERM protein [Pseudomonadota bacterium]
MKVSLSKIIGAIASMVLAGASFSANASPIQFIFTGVGSGSLGGVGFSDTAFVFTAFGDTASAQSCWSGSTTCTFIASSSAEVSLSGIGNYDFLTGTRTFDNNGFVGFSRYELFNRSDLYNVFNVGSAYDMASPIGPVSGNASLLQWSNGTVSTTGGALVFNSASTSGTFQAVMVTAVPEPETYAMLLAGLGLVGSVARRRKQKNATV